MPEFHCVTQHAGSFVRLQIRLCAAGGAVTGAAGGGIRAK